MAFTRTQLKLDIMVSLGNNKVPVELGDPELELAITQALEVYSQYKPKIRKESYKTNPSGGIDVHDLPADVTGVRYAELTLAISGTIGSGLALENAMLSGAPVYYGVGDTMMDISYLDLRRRWLKMVARELAADPDWAAVQDPTTNHWQIYTYATAGLFVDVDATVPHDDDLSSIPSFSQKWIRDWSTSEAMMTLGNIRGKYDKIPVAGGFMALDGPHLRARAEAWQQQLLHQVETRRADLFPRWA